MDYILIDSFQNGLRSAFIENQKLTNLVFDPFLGKKQGNIDDIVSGRVVSIRSDFVWIDAARDQEGVIKLSNFNGKVPKVGDFIWAQISRMPWPEHTLSNNIEKGYRLTPRILIAGRCWLYGPKTPFQLEKWTKRSTYCQDILKGSEQESLDHKAVAHEKLFFADIFKRLAAPPSRSGLFYQGFTQWQRWIRDLQKPTVVIASTPQIAQQVTLWMKNFISHTFCEVRVATLHQLPLFETFDVEDAFHNCLTSIVPLKGGGSFEIRECSAATLIDINTGSQALGAYEMNLLSLVSLKQQILWRNLSGNIFVDFIRLPNTKLKMFTQMLQDLFQDTDIHVVGFCELGLMQLQRKRLRPSLSSSLLTHCHYCKGEGASYQE